MPERNNGGTTADSTTKVSWRGRMAARAKVVRHRWQKDWTAQPLEHLQTREHWRRIRTLGLLGASLTLIVALVGRLLFAPQLTPFIAMASTDYAWPASPRAWAREDLSGLTSALDGQNLSVANISDDWRTREAGLRSLDQQLDALANDARQAEILIVWLSMPGVVDGAGAPCLIPPGASPLDPGTWLPVSEVTAHIRARQFPRSCRVLLVLDAARADVDWKLGTLENTFVAGLESWWRSADMPQLAVLHSAALGQRSWTSSELQGSVFGHYFRLGLAGEADAITGNNDRQVTLQELMTYLQREVDSWAKFHRGAEQRPTLIPSGAADSRIAWALRPAARKRIAAMSPPGQAPVVTDAELAALWSARERLLNGKLISNDAEAWHGIEHDLLRLEQQVRGGAAFRESARALGNQLKSRLESWETRLAGDSRWRIQAGQNLWPGDTRTHSIAEALRLAGDNPGEAKQQLNVLRSLIASPAPQSLHETVAALRPLSAPVASEAQLLNILSDAVTATWWQDPIVVAEVLRRQMEAAELGAPGDPRCAVWAAPGVAAGDGARRAAIDQLLIGSETSVAAASQQAESAAAFYHSAADWTALATEAYEFCDRTAAELPYVSEWLAQPRPSPSDAARFDRLINESLLPLVEDLQRLNRSLAHGEGAAAQAPADTALLRMRLAELRTRYEQLREILLEQSRALAAEKSPDGRSLRSMQTLLATPLLPASLRDELWRSSAKLSAALHRRYSQEPRPDPPALEPDSYHDRVTSGWAQHPLAALWKLTHTEQGGAAATDSIALGDRARRHAARLAERARSALAAGGDPRTEQPNVALSAADGEATLRRDSWSEWESALRAAAPWMPSRDESVLTAVRRLDLQQLQLWNAQRSLDDFFGPPAPGEAAFFVTAAHDYLSNARKLAAPGPAAQQEIERLTTLLDARRVAMQSLSATAADLLVVDPRENLDITVRVARDLAAPNELPAGTPAIWVRDLHGRLPVGAAAEFSAEPVKFTLAATELADRGPALDAVISLRGNERSAAFLLRPPVGGAVDVSWHRYGPPQVVVQGRRRQPASVMFVLDASFSMRDLIPGVESAGQATEIPRMDAAKDALRRMLTQLAFAGDARVGVRVFGHRVGWTTSEPTQILPQTNYGRPFPPDLSPAEDVELILPLGRFDDSVAGEIDEILAQVVPWGQSPLYLALRQALDDFTGENPDAERRIVVITDGANYQFNALSPTTRDDVLSLAEGRNVPIHIVGFGIPAGEVADATTDFQAIAERTGGSYVPVENATSLISSLEELLGPTEYRVIGPNGELYGPARVGTQVAIAPTPTRATEFTVTAAAAARALELAGGEAIELQLDRGGRDLLVVPFDLEDAVTTPLVAGAEDLATDRIFAAHRALRSQDGVTFTFSIQGAKRDFVSRPGELWIELTPLAADGRRLPRSYYLYDANYVPDTSCPVVSWRALNWPDAARAAHVKVWLRQQTTSSNLAIGNLGDASHQSGTTHRVPELDAVECQLRVRLPGASGEPTRVSLVERHTAESPGLGALRVQMTPPPVNVTHRWDEEHGLIVHLFELDADVRTLERYQLQLTRFEKLSAEAWHAREPLTVEIGASDNLLRLEPPSQ